MVWSRGNALGIFAPAAERRIIMSKDYPCIYWNDGKCKKFSDDKVTSWCVWSPCASQTPSNADRIRSMSDEELKKFICSMFKCEFCDFELGERCGLLNWLQMPAEEADNE